MPSVYADVPAREREPFVGWLVKQHRLELRHVEPRRGWGVDTEVAARDLAVERRALEVEESGRAFEIGQRGGVGAPQPIELGPAAQLPLEHVQKRQVVAREDAKQRRHIAADVVDVLGSALAGRRRNTPPTTTKGSAWVRRGTVWISLMRRPARLGLPPRYGATGFTGRTEIDSFCLGAHTSPPDARVRGVSG